VAEPVVLDSRVREVCVFRSGAVVTRIAEVKANGAWPEEVSLIGLPLAIDDESVRVSVVGPADAKLPRPADVRVDLVVPEIGEPLLPPDEKEMRAAADDIERLTIVLQRIDRETGRLDSIGLSLPEPFENRPPKPAPAAAWSGVIDWKHRWKRERAEERRRVHDDLLRAKETLARLRRRMRELRASQDSRESRVSKRVRLRLRDAARGEAEGGSPGAKPLETRLPVAATIRLEYRVPGARWVPTYVFRMGRDGKTAQLSVKALVVQSSGEPWERVKLAVSTADLLRDNELPELKSLRIGRRQPEAPKRAYRDPPSGLDSLFEGLDNAIATSEPPPPIAPPAPPSDPGIDALISGSLGRTEQAEGRFDENAGPSNTGSASLAKSARAMDRSSSERNEKKKEAPKPKGAGRGMASPTTTTPMPPPPPAMAPMKSRAPGGPPQNQPARAPSSVAARMEPSPDMALEMDDQDKSSLADGMASLGGFGGGAMAGKDLARRPIAQQAPSPGLLKFSDLVMAGWDDDGTRGRLRAATIADRLAGLDASHAPGVAGRLQEAEARAEESAYITFPGETQDVGSSSGSYDHRYDAEGLADVPGDGRIHSVPLLTRTAPVATTLVVVPRESTQAVRVAEMRNPLESPLLAGPAEIYLDDEFLVTSPIRTVPAGADLRIGLGIEEALKVARNTHFEEEATGLLGGGALLHHKVEIELANRLTAPVKIDVRERVPIKNEEDDLVDITVPAPSPAWEDYDQEETGRIKGGRRWRVTLAAGESKKIFWTYSIKIDSKNEVVGGNRRE